MPQQFLTEADRRYLDNLSKFYETRQSLLLPALHLVYKKYNYITRKAMEEIANFLGIHPIKVFEAVSFYHYFQNPENKPYKLKVCTNVSCLLKGANKIFLAAYTYYNSSKNIQSLLCIEECECVAACDKAPVAIVQDKYIYNLSEEKLVELMKNLDKEGKI